ncbi:putative acetyltransferase [Vibrio sinaloensis DSM 21326]|uniref:Putative acetyltransferase n=1 Tax=Vibrio sinaloensis DSM 21326 TaxID=945550 RepID=E8M935_PHOS4|nr:GNAT family N-acetyltransferase [Vibrio sinaloensis]EGA69391.1 putative acetyltransferase [Vibrio sinaloensis DSM 21326]
MTLEWVSVRLQEFELLFDCVKQGLYAHVKPVFGWNDEFQRERLKNEYEFSWFHWILRDGEKVGVVCFKPYDNAIHLHLLVIQAEHQGLGIGRKVMKQLHQKVIDEKRTALTLSSFIGNTRAIALYQDLGYQIVEREDHFVSMKRTFSAQ